jgi:hypothetical protein
MHLLANMADDGNWNVTALSLIGVLVFFGTIYSLWANYGAGRKKK